MASRPPLQSRYVLRDRRSLRPITLSGCKPTSTPVVIEEEDDENKENEDPLAVVSRYYAPHC